MRRIIPLCALLVVAVPGFAQDAKPNTLTPKEIADGWILLFDCETTFGWKTQGTVQVANGTLTLSNSASVGPTSIVANYELAFECSGSGLLKFGDDKAKNAVFGTPADQWLRVKLKFEVLPDKPRSLQQQGLVVENGVFVGTYTSNYPKCTQLWLEAKTTLALRNVKLRPLGVQSLFSGTDLTGWKIFPGKKSEFSVSDGAIHIKNGPGDLQTEKKFGDFCLQLECISHGPHLNSGVFFRCRPNEYQNGYEAQIRNQFTEKPTQKYVLEDYDPMTHKLLGKKEAFFTAVDYGTGAIYRRQPARKEVAKDKEWFTMTIVAHGNHLATWVNGIQVTDWHDNRPPSDNARTGCRLEAGHISLQGHDPTTDLSFRNFRIQEYPK